MTGYTTHTQTMTEAQATCIFSVDKYITSESYLEVWLDIAKLVINAMDNDNDRIKFGIKTGDTIFSMTSFSDQHVTKAEKIVAMEELLRAMPSLRNCHPR